MKIVPKRTLTWVYLDPESEIEGQLCDWLEDGQPEENQPPVVVWLFRNVERRWRYSNGIRHIKGDERSYTVVRFRREDEAVLFRMKWETRAPEIDVVAANEQWTENPAEPTARTFSKTARVKWWQAQPTKRGALKGKRVTYGYYTERNAAGFFLGLQFVGGCATSERIARRRKKDVIAWAKRKAGAV